MKISISGWLYARPNEYDPANPQIRFWDGAETKYWVEQGYVPLCAHTIDVDAPDIDIVSGQIQCLLAKRDALVKEFNQATSKIDGALAQLKCLTFDSAGIAS